MLFSRRTSWDKRPNALAHAREEARERGMPLFDLTESNPTRARLFESAPLVAELGHARGTIYEPSPFGHEEARAAVCAYYSRRGTVVEPSSVVLAASTSESYGWLFKLLCDPGDEVLIPRPSYPLFSFLADLEGVRLRPFRLVLRDGFRVDVGDLEASLSAKTRAIVLVHPNNPTGSFLREEDRRLLVQIARERNLALIVDEVFGDYAFDARRIERPPTFVGESEVVTFVLSGLSKVVALPQLKLGWIVASGPDAPRAEALGRLEFIADSYLSVSTPVQRALPALLRASTEVSASVRARTTENLRRLDELLARSPPVFRLPLEAGWYATLAVPQLSEGDAADEERTALLLAREDGVFVHPGFFFDFDEPGRFVVSLLPEAPVFEEGASRLLARLRRETFRARAAASP